MFRAIFLLIIRSISTVFTASGIIHVSCCRPATTHMYNTRGCKYSWDAPDDERKYRLKHVEQPRNNKLSYVVAACWSFSYITRIKFCPAGSFSTENPTWTGLGTNPLLCVETFLLWFTLTCIDPFKNMSVCNESPTCIWGNLWNKSLHSFVTQNEVATVNSADLKVIWGRNAGWGCLRIGCWRKYLDLRGTTWQGNGESCITRSWMICTPYPILCGW